MSNSKNNILPRKNRTAVGTWAITSLLLCGLLASISGVLQQQSADAQILNGNGSGSNIAATMAPPTARIDTSPPVAVIIITRDGTGAITFQPNTVTIRVGEEILILNNDTAPQSFTNGNGGNDPMAGKLFDTGLIQPKQFVEYVAANLQQGTYPFYSVVNPSAKGTLVVTG